MAVSTETDANSLEQFLDRCRKEYEQKQQGLKEIDLLIQQTTAEVERMAQRNTQATNRLRQIEANVETVSRSDIQESYTAVLETRQRLFMMRGQLEKLQSDQRNLTEYLDLLRSILEFEEQVDEHGEGEGEGGEAAQPLIVRIIEAQERERRRLSRQMHDGPAQSLTNLVLQAEICERLMDSDPDRARGELTNLKNAVGSTFQKVKGFILNLRPMMLDDLGLVPTLRRYVESFSDNSGVRTNLTVTGKEKRLASHKEVTAFRIIQELLNNAQEYSHASSVQINVDVEDESIHVSVEDDGDGFDLTDALVSAEAERLGLTTMRERVEMLGGQIQVDSGLGRGTKVSFDLPVS